MTDETKKHELLFDVPLRMVSDDAGYIVYNHSNRIVCQDAFYVDAKRITRLPELYDALVEAAAGKCWSCAGENSETMLDKPCPKGHDEDCYVAKWRQVLKKVRDGK